MSDRGFQVAVAAHYRKERDRAETCLGDILNILSDGPDEGESQKQAILDRLIKFYSREDVQ